jgi:hypothetical protein
MSHFTLVRMACGPNRPGKLVGSTKHHRRFKLRREDKLGEKERLGEVSRISDELVVEINVT